jgi:DNA-directed RNA polymerase subunit alpha
MRELELHRPQAVVLDEDRSTPTYGLFTAQPFERGWGVTIGNALRRILLSSIEGSAIIAVRFAGVHHEYDSIPGVMEDVTDLILNLKRAPLKLTGPESIMATLQVSEPGVLKAGAIKGGPELSIVDPGVYLATLTEEGAVDAELAIRRGRGYVPADDQDAHNLGVGFIHLDAAYSPVRKANYRIEPARVGQATDYEKLVLEVWTNGAVTATGAVVEASRLLADHLPIFQNLEEGPVLKPVSRSEGVLEKRIEELELGGRITNMLRNAGIGNVRELVGTGEDELFAIPGFGKKALTEVREKLEALGLSLGVRFDLPRS